MSSKIASTTTLEAEYKASGEFYAKVKRIFALQECQKLCDIDEVEDAVRAQFKEQQDQAEKNLARAKTDLCFLAEALLLPKEVWNYPDYVHAIVAARVDLFVQYADIFFATSQKVEAVTNRPLKRSKPEGILCIPYKGQTVFWNGIDTRLDYGFLIDILEEIFIEHQNTNSNIYSEGVRLEAADESVFAKVENGTAHLFLFCKQIGNGGSANVSKVLNICAQPGEDCFAAHKKPLNNKSVQVVNHEVSMLQHFNQDKQQRHPHVVGKPITTLGQHGYVCRYFKNKKLSTMITNDSIDFIQRIDWIRQFYLGYRALIIEGGVIHRDLKPQNCLLDEQLQLCITDLGSAWIKGRKRPSHCTGSTVDYQHPEAASRLRSCAEQEREFLTEASDFWTAGGIAFQILTKMFPTRKENGSSVDLSLLNSLPISPRLKEGLRKILRLNFNLVISPLPYEEVFKLMSSLNQSDYDQSTKVSQLAALVRCISLSEKELTEAAKTGFQKQQKEADASSLEANLKFLQAESLLTSEACSQPLLLDQRMERLMQYVELFRSLQAGNSGTFLWKSVDTQFTYYQMAQLFQQVLKAEITRDPDIGGNGLNLKVGDKKCLFKVINGHVHLLLKLSGEELGILKRDLLLNVTTENKAKLYFKHIYGTDENGRKVLARKAANLKYFWKDQVSDCCVEVKPLAILGDNGCLRDLEIRSISQVLTNASVQHRVSFVKQLFEGYLALTQKGFIHGSLIPKLMFVDNEDRLRISMSEDTWIKGKEPDQIDNRPQPFHPGLKARLALCKTYQEKEKIYEFSDQYRLAITAFYILASTTPFRKTESNGTVKHDLDDLSNLNVLAKFGYSPYLIKIIKDIINPNNPPVFEETYKLIQSLNLVIDTQVTQMIATKKIFMSPSTPPFDNCMEAVRKEMQAALESNNYQEYLRAELWLSHASFDNHPNLRTEMENRINLLKQCASFGHWGPDTQRAIFNRCIESLQKDPQEITRGVKLKMNSGHIFLIRLENGIVEMFQQLNFLPKGEVKSNLQAAQDKKA